MLTSLRIEQHYCAQVPPIIIRPVNSELPPYQGLWSDSCSDIKPAVGSRSPQHDMTDKVWQQGSEGNFQRSLAELLSLRQDCQEER